MTGVKDVLCLCGCGKPVRSGRKYIHGHNMPDQYDWSNVVADYKKVKNVYAVARKYGASPTTVKRQLLKRGVEIHQQRRHDYSEFIRDYLRTKSIVEVAKKHNTNPSTVSLAFKRSGFKISHDNKEIATSSGLGRYGEILALKLLQGSVDVNNNVNVNAPTDIVWNGLKINVKTSTPRYSISRGKKFHNIKWNYKIVNPNYETDERLQSDYYLFLGLDEGLRLEKAFLVPSNVIGKTVTIGRGSSKYDEYMICKKM